MRRMAATLISTLAVLSITALPSLAANPHFVSASASLSGKNLVVSFKEAGLGDNQLISYLATANATAQYACFNGGGKHPQATNKEQVSGPVSAGGTFSSGKNGQISESLTIAPPGPGSFSCPNGQRLVLTYVAYTNVQIADTTNNVVRQIPGTFSAGALV